MSSHHRDLSKLKSILSYRRPHKSASEYDFIKRFIIPLGVERDEFGNYYKRIEREGVPNDTLWSCHTDTVHHKAGRQTVVYDKPKRLLRLADPKASDCLGADCGAGVFVMSEMILAGVPGLYVFHRDEEHGANGARHIRDKTGLLGGITKAIAFDRMGPNSIITFQCGARTASNAFATSLAEQLKESMDLDYKADPGGMFTDTQVYADIVPECTNLSVGYDRAHSSHETLAVDVVLDLRDAMLKIDSAKLVVARDPTKIERQSYYGYGFNSRYTDQFGLYSDGTMSSLLTNYPNAVSRILGRLNVSYEAMARAISEDLDSYKKSLDELFPPSGGVEEIDDDLSPVGDEVVMFDDDRDVLADTRAKLVDSSSLIGETTDDEFHPYA